MGEIRWEQDSHYMCAVVKGWKIDFYCKMMGKNRNKHIVRDYNGQQKDSQGGDHPLMECTMVSV